MRPRTSRALLVLTIAASLVGCGYRVLDGRDVFGPEVTQIEITMFENESVEPAFELMVGDAVAETFELRGPLACGCVLHCFLSPGSTDLCGH